MKYSLFLIGLIFIFFAFFRVEKETHINCIPPIIFYGDATLDSVVYINQRSPYIVVNGKEYPTEIGFKYKIVRR